ncbi:MAG TPA: hypothetical protein VJB87_04085 [Candidatus Nanoarchaeia archaeon]|nr:hypothetical protein [Candidatus Nanoarchaeia archaeon]
MPENQTDFILGEALIRKDGIFDLTSLYKIPAEWGSSKGYLKIDKEIGKKYGSDGGEYEIKWMFIKKIDEYSKYTADIEIWVYKGLEVLVEHNGKEVPRIKGKIDVKIKLKMTTNMERAFNLTKKHQFIRKFLEKYIWKNRINALQGQGNEEFLDLQERIKKGLEQYT